MPIEKHLQNIGLTLPFSKSANFTFISEFPFYINHFIASTHILVDEDGIISSEPQPGMSTRYAGMSNPDVIFNVNKPFVFIVHDNVTKCIVYCCAIIDPSQSTNQL